jgi:hypothetical protein
MRAMRSGCCYSSTPSISSTGDPGNSGAPHQGATAFDGHRAPVLASSLFLFINNLVGLGTLVIGRLSDHFTGRYGSESLRYAILSGTGFYLISAVLFAVAALRLAREWQC